MGDRSEFVDLLLVDDEPDALLAIEWALEGLPLRVRSATSGEAALASVRHAPPEIVLSDHQLGGMDGLTFLAEVRREHPRTLCVLHTGSAIRPGAGCAFPVLAKPSSSEALRGLVSRLIAEIRARTASGVGSTKP
ncbi:MAG: response regulator [Myxococcaceae bacterium]